MSRGFTSSLSPFASALAIAGTIFLTSTAGVAARSQSGQSSQQSQAQQNQQPALLTSAQVDDQTLEQFTRSYLEVMQIQQKLRDDLANEKDAAKAQQIRQDASQRMAKSISDHQLTVAKFNQILASIPKDQDLGKRFIAMQSKVQQG